jgi:hypothetical protein
MTEGSEEARRIESPEDLTAYLSRHPASVSLAVISGTGTVQHGHRAEAKQPLYRLPHMLLLAAAMERMHDARLDSTEQVPLEEIEAFALPGLTGEAYEEMVDSLRAQNQVRGDALPLAAVVRGMVTYQSAAAADWLMTRLGREVVDGLPEAYGLTQSDAPRPVSGTYVTWIRERNASADSLRIEPSLGMAPEAYADTVWAAASQLAADASFRETTAASLAERGTGLSVIQQRELAAVTFPAGTALDYARLLAQIYAGGPIAPEGGTASGGSGWRDMQALIETPLRQMAAPAVSERIDSLAAVGGLRSADPSRTVALANVAGAYPGLLTLGGYARSAAHTTSSPDASQVRIVVLMMHDLPVAVFYQLAQTGIDKGLFLQLLADDDAPERIVRQIRLTSTVSK